MLNLPAKLRKLRKMTPQEILGRVNDHLRKQLEKRQIEKRLPLLDDETLATVAPHIVDRAMRLVPGSLPNNLDEFSNRFSQAHELMRERSKRRAERVIAGQYSFLGRDIEFAKQDSINWQRDPLSAHEWPREYYADLDLYELPNDIDVKYVWELNRHQFFFDLATAWNFTGDDRYARHLRELILDWIDSNPLYIGVNWTSGLEVAMRSISWLWSLAVAGRWHGWNNGDLVRITKSLAEHAFYLQRHFSHYSSPYNHLVGESTGLFLLGKLLHGLPVATKWEKSGRRVLQEAGPRQFYSDGFCVEQAMGYHFFTLGFLSQALIAARQDGTPLSELERVAEKAYRAGCVFQQPDGLWPTIGDIDSARSMPVGPDDFWDFRSLMSLGGALFDLPIQENQKDSFSPELYWLMGIEGIQKFRQNATATEANNKSRILATSGYAVARGEGINSGDWLLFDTGPIAHGLHSDDTPSVAHGHLDLFQLLLFQKGYPLLVDSGMPRYAGAREWVDYFRGPSAHNTMEIEGLSIAKPAGRLAWSNVRDRATLRANLSPEAWFLQGNWISSETCSLERTVFGLPGYGIWVLDYLRSSQERLVRWHWNLPSASTPSMTTGGDGTPSDPYHTRASFDIGVLSTWSEGSHATHCIVSPKPNGPEAWRAPGYGVLEKGCRLSFETAVREEFLLVTFIGSQEAPIRIASHGHQLACHPSNDERTPDTAPCPNASHYWSVRTEQGWQTFATKDSIDSNNSEWATINCKAEWPIVHSRSIASSLK